ncbi:MAG: MmgE/PrpD family protein [Thermodesulfobacteriota bacterium]
MSVTRQLIEFIGALTFDDLPPETVTAAKKAAIDTLGAAIAGSSAAGVAPAAALMREWAGKPESTVLVFGDKLPVIQSAFVNSMMAHALDFDDIHDKVAIHASCSVVPTALAMAECLGGLQGKDLVTAIAVGVEVASRIGLSILEQERGWHLSAVCGTMANAAVAGKLLGLDYDQMRNTLGIAYSQASGTLQSLVDGTLTKRMQPGFAARSGILSACLAKKGLTGPVNFLEGKFGLFKLFFGDKCAPEAMVDQLGSRFEINSLGSKPYPCCRLSHTAVDAVLELLAEDTFSLDEVQTIDVYGSSAMNTMCGKPYAISATSQIDAQFSLQYLLILTILKKRIRIDDFSGEAVRDSRIIGQVDKVKVHVSPDIRNRWGAIVKVKLRDGRMLSRRVDIPKGQPENPMQWSEYVEKFNNCAGYAAKPLNPKNLEQFVELVEALESVEDSNALTRLLI